MNSWIAPLMVIFAYIEEPPFATHIGGRVSGSDVELARLVLDRMGIKDIEIRKVEFADLLPGVAAGRWTMNTGLFITPERCKEVAFSDPIWALADGMIVRRGNPRNIDSYAAIETNAGAKLGIIRGTKQGVIAEEEGVLKKNVVEFGTQEEALNALRDGKIDAYAATALGNRVVLAGLASDDLELAANFQPPQKRGRPAAGFGAYSFAKSDPAFVARFNEALAAVLGGPEHRAMLSRFGFTDAEIDPAIAMRGRLSELCG